LENKCRHKAAVDLTQQKVCFNVALNIVKTAFERASAFLSEKVAQPNSL